MQDRLYLSILRRSWRISTEHRWLWYLGLFAAILGNGGAFNIVINNLSFLEEQGNFFESMRSLFTEGIMGIFLSNLLSVFTHLNVWSAILIILIAFVVGFVMWLVFVSYGALVYAANSFQTTRPADIHGAWRRGIARFWPTAGVQIVSRLILYAALLIVSVPLLSLYLVNQATLWNTLWLAVLFVFLVPFAWILAVVIRYASMYVVLERKGVRASLRAGWKLFCTHWLASIEMAAVLFLCNLGFGLVIAAVMLAIAVPFFLFILTMYTLGFFTWFWIISVLFVATEFVVVLFLGAWFSVFQTTAWVLVYEKIRAGHFVAKIIRFFRMFESSKPAKV